jgi:hypothetical protein
MRDSRVIINKQSGEGQSGYTLSLYTYSSNSPYYTTPKIGDYTDNGDGTYYLDITTTVKGTLVLTTNDDTLVPTNFIGHLFQGDNQLTLEP